MSMSTKIEDLPGPPAQIIQRQQPHEPEPEAEYHSEVDTETHTSNIRANIKKKVSFSDHKTIEEFDETEDKKDVLRSEFSEENMLVFAIIFAAALPALSNHIKSLPFLGLYATSDISTAFLKALILFITFILIKIFVLPRLKL